MEKKHTVITNSIKNFKIFVICFNSFLILLIPKFDFTCKNRSCIQNLKFPCRESEYNKMRINRAVCNSDHDDLCAPFDTFIWTWHDKHKPCGCDNIQYHASHPFSVCKKAVEK